MSKSYVNHTSKYETGSNAAMRELGLRDTWDYNTPERRTAQHRAVRRAAKALCALATTY